MDVSWPGVTVQRDIVYSGLEDTMRASTAQVVNIAHTRDCSYRIAAFVSALEKIAQVYRESGFTM